MSLDGISMHPLSIELDRAIAGGRIDKINQPNKQSIIMALRMPGKNIMLHISINPQNPAMHIVDKAPENPPEPPMFCMVLRKHLETGRIASVRQYGLDRLLIVDIDFLAAGGQIITKSLMVELMGKYSNIILVQDGMIIDSLRKVGANSSRIRTILPGDKYILPPQQDKLNLLEVPDNQNGGASEDYSFMSSRVQELGGQSCYFMNLNGLSGPIHHPRFDFQEEALVNGVKAFAGVAADLLIPD